MNGYESEIILFLAGMILGMLLNRPRRGRFF